jgi:hypothetical protein
VTGHHNGVGARWQPRVFEGECLAQQTLDPVAVNGATDLPRH